MKFTMKRKTNSGFTLIEVVIVVGIIAIIAAFAYPGYKKQVNQTRRSDAHAALTTKVALQERWFTQSNSYTDDMNNLGGMPSDEGYYSVDVNIPATSQCTVTRTGLSTLFYCYTLTATAVGVQLNNDDECRTLSIDHTGKKTSTNAGGTLRDPDNGVCWQLN